MVAFTKESTGLRTLNGEGRVVQDIGSASSKGLSALLGGKNTPEPREENTTEESTWPHFRSG